MNLSRRRLLEATGAVTAIAALGLRSQHGLAAENGVLKIATGTDLAGLDPGYIIGGTDSTVLFATMPSLARPIQDKDGIWGWAPSEYVESIEQVDDTHIRFALKKGLMWSDGAGELSAEDVKFSFER